VRCDLISAIAAASVDMVVSNPRTCRSADRAGLQREVRDYEPDVALSPTDGFEIYEKLVAIPRACLRPGGCSCSSLGYTSKDRVTAMLGAYWCAYE